MLQITIGSGLLVGYSRTLLDFVVGMGRNLDIPALRFSATYEYLVICLVFIGLILFVCLEREHS